MRNARLAGLTLLLAAVVTIGEARGDWTRWRGPNGDARVSEPGWETQAAAGLRVAWRADLGRGHSAVVVLGDRLYTMGMRALPGEARAAEEIVYCLSAATGKEIWRYAYRTRARNWPGPSATPVVEGGLVYVVGREGEVYALDAAKGTVVWKRHLVEDKLARTPQWGFCSSPVVEGQLLLLSGGRSGIALDKRTGKVVWSSEAVVGSLATPVVFSRGGRRLAAIGGGGAVSIVEVASGKVRWSERWESDVDPTVLGDRLLLAGGGRTNGSSLLRMQDAGAKAVWTSPNLGGGFQSPVALDGHAYGFGRERRQTLQCVDLATGQLKWSQDLGEWGSLIAVNKTLLIAEGDGELVLAEASPTGYRETARLRVIAMTDTEKRAREDAMRALWTAPVFANGRIFLRDNFGALVCVTPRS